MLFSQDQFYNSFLVGPAPMHPLGWLHNPTIKRSIYYTNNRVAKYFLEVTRYTSCDWLSKLVQFQLLRVNYNPSSPVTFRNALKSLFSSKPSQANAPCLFMLQAASIHVAVARNSRKLSEGLFYVCYKHLTWVKKCLMQLSRTYL